MRGRIPITLAAGMFFLGLYVGQLPSHETANNTDAAIATAKEALKAAHDWESVAKQNEKIATDCINLLRQH